VDYVYDGNAVVAAADVGSNRVFPAKSRKIITRTVSSLLAVA
jgi:hypothetical protein